MKLVFDAVAMEKIKAKMAEANVTGETKLVLDMDDGVGPYSKSGTCTLGVHFKLHFVPGEIDTKIFDGEGESELGAFHFKKYTEAYLRDVITVKYNATYSSFILDSDFEQIDPGMELVFH